MPRGKTFPEKVGPSGSCTHSLHASHSFKQCFEPSRDLNFLNEIYIGFSLHRDSLEVAISYHSLLAFTTPYLPTFNLKVNENSFSFSLKSFPRSLLFLIPQGVQNRISHFVADLADCIGHS